MLNPYYGGNNGIPPHGSGVDPDAAQNYQQLQQLYGAQLYNQQQQGKYSSRRILVKQVNITQSRSV